MISLVRIAIRKLPVPRLPGERAPSRLATMQDSHADAGSFLSLEQERIYFFENLVSGTIVYNLTFALTIAGPIDGDLLDLALVDLVGRHDLLRSRYYSDGGVPRRRIDPPPQSLLVRADGGLVSTTDRDAHLNDLANRPFDLELEAPFRATLVRFGPEDHVLLLSIHHIAADARSIDVILRDLGVLYTRQHHQGVAALPDLASRYADYADQQRSPEAAGDLAPATRYWLDRLQDVPLDLELPFDRQDPRARTRFDAESVHALVPQRLAHAVRLLAAREETTAFTVFLAGFSLMLSRMSAQESLVIGVPVRGRRDPALTDLVGMFVNTLPVALSPLAATSVRALLRETHVMLMADRQRDHVPFDLIVRTLNPPRSGMRHPVFQAVANYRSFDQEAFRAPKLRCELRQLPSLANVEDLSLVIEKRGERFALTLAYAADCFSAETARGWLDAFVVLLGEMVRRPKAKPSSLPMLSRAQRKRFCEGQIPA